MCGIAGIWNSSGADHSRTLPLMSQALAHRGPDSSGQWTNTSAGIGLVHRRLAVVDISDTGRQPMSSPDNRYILCFNGEIYNHLSIRQQIEAEHGKYTWRGTSDTETLLAAIATFGLIASIEKSVGMFAFALWDQHLRQLSLVRDRFGEKPLYYGWHKNHFVFSSELQAIAVIPDVELRIDNDALNLYFRHNYVPAPYSIYQNIRKLEPGCMLTLNASNAEPEHNCYWSAVTRAKYHYDRPINGSFDEIRDATESMLSQAVQHQMVADVPIGAFLSGGIDSSTVVALMQNNTSARVNTFSIGFEDEKLNEAHHAKAVAKALNTDHTELYLSNSDINELVQNLPSITDEPFADSSVLPTYAVSALARQSVTVSLSGDGGDELFGGYTRFATAEKIIKLRHRSGTLGRTMAKALISSPFMKRSLSGTPLWRLGALQKNGAGLNSSLLMQMLAQNSDALAYRELLSFWRNPHSPLQVSSVPTSYFHDTARWLSQQRYDESVQLMDVQTFLTDDILVKVDRAAMNVSLETRVPMLDHRFAEFVWSLPPKHRTYDIQRQTAPKEILKSIAAKYVPLEQLERPKMGFGVPLQTWLQGPLREWAEALIEPDHIQRQGILNEQMVRNTWKQLMQGQPRAAELMWSILMFQHWLQRSPVGVA